jgi:NAD(P)-dependent dehydrogenase (short-subunit alcohol dehydrogenase family)
MFEGKTVFVSGAASGIGRATALFFARHGAKVAAVDIVSEALEQTVDQIRAVGGQARALTCDVRDHAAVADAVNQTVAWGCGLHHAFNNAGVMGEHLNPWDEAAVTNTIQVNLMGVIWAMKHQVAHMGDNGVAPSSTPPRSPASPARSARWIIPLPSTAWSASAKPRRCATGARACAST